jgi:hypothetical protein
MMLSSSCDPLLMTLCDLLDLCDYSVGYNIGTWWFLRCLIFCLWHFVVLLEGSIVLDWIVWIVLHSSWGHAPTTSYDVRIQKTTRWKVTAMKTSDLTLYFSDGWLCDFEIDHRLGILADLKGNMQVVVYLYCDTTYLIVLKQTCNRMWGSKANGEN